MQIPWLKDLVESTQFMALGRESTGEQHARGKELEPNTILKVMPMTHPASLNRVLY